MKNQNVKHKVFNQGVLINGFNASKDEMELLKKKMLKVSNKIPDKMKIQYKLNALVHEMEDYLKNSQFGQVAGSILWGSLGIWKIYELSTGKIEHTSFFIQTF